MELTHTKMHVRRAQRVVDVTPGPENWNQIGTGGVFEFCVVTVKTAKTHCTVLARES